MSYYEELGIESNASKEEIRSARKRLIRAIHPDQHVDEIKRRLAEVRTRHLNSIAEMLLDPEERRRYDKLIREKSRAAAKQGFPWWIATLVGTGLSIVATIWYCATHLRF
jgi:curved DNA-binding protein